MMGNLTSSSLVQRLEECSSDEPCKDSQPTIYDPLDTAKSETRICRILPALPDQMTACELKRISLDDTPRYSGLSYAWGKHQNTAQISLNGQMVSVTANLSIILERLRGHGLNEYFWIDVICINQADAQEKGQQVELMGRIYRQACEVFIWLGPETIAFDDSREPDVIVGADDAASDGNDSAEAIETLKSLAEGTHFHQLPCFGQCYSTNCQSRTTRPHKSWQATKESLISLLEVPWFTRTWVVQEIVLARKAVLMHGDHSLQWEILVAAWNNWDQHSQDCCADCVSTLSESEYTLLHRLRWQVQDLERMRQQASDHSLLRLLLGFRDRKATDSRDKIFGMLGLVSEKSLLKITPNYEASVVEVYTQLAIQLIQAYGWLVPLHLPLEQNITGLPSWVPDWTYCDNDPTGYSLARLMQAVSYQVGSLDGERLPVADKGVLMVRGAKIDTVKDVSAVFVLKGREDEHLNLILEWRNFLDLDRKKDDAYIRGGTLYEAYQATVFANRYEDEAGWRLQLPGDFERWELHLRDVTRRLRGEGPGAASTLDQSMSAHNVAVLRRRLCILAKGFIGLCPARTEIGDYVYVVDHSRAPIFLRPVSETHGTGLCSQGFRALGHGYVHGLMDGEAASLGLPVSSIRII